MNVPNIDLRNADCLPFIKQCKDNEFNLAIVDPPYGIGDTWSKSRNDTFFRKGKLHKYDNKDIPDQEYFKQIQRISINQIIWGGNYYTEFLRPTNSWIIWDKEKSEKSYMSEAEVAWTSFSKLMKIYRHIWDGGRKGKETGIKKIHPHQKPFRLYEWILINYAKKGDKILDTHLGSGSIAIACYNLRFDLTAFEIDKKYFDAAKKRLEIHQMQLNMFREAI